jgi:hypothetical protein
MKLAMQHVQDTLIGYGQLGCALADSLRLAGVEVLNPKLTPEDFDNGGLPTTPAALWVTVPSHVRGWWDEQQVWCFTMFESTRLPDQYTSAFENITGFIVPNELNREQFSELHPNVHQVPLGVDPELWSVKPRWQTGPFMDFLICGSGERKGTDLAFRAFHDAFPKPYELDPSPRLVMKDHRTENEGPGIIRIGQRLDDEDLVALYHSAHVYVQPSRGEGWGLQPHQALATGMPAIISDIPGHREYAHLPGALSIPTKQVPSSYVIYGDSGDWWEPDYDALVQAYRDMWVEYDDWVERAIVSAGEIRRTLTWEHTAQGVISAIGPDVLAAPSLGRGRWCPAPQRKYLVVVNRDWAADIAGLSYVFRKGHRYQELADVKRILYEADLLDPVCLRADDPELGLTGPQIEQLRAYGRGLRTPDLAADSVPGR